MTVNYIEGAVRVPEEFDRVAAVEFDTDTIRFIADSGAAVEESIHAGFLFSGELE